MLATIEQMSALTDVTADLNRHKLRSHIAKMLAKILVDKRTRIDNSQDCVEAELS